MPSLYSNNTTTYTVQSTNVSTLYSGSTSTVITATTYSTNLAGLYGGSYAALPNNAEQLILLFDNAGNVHFALDPATGNQTIMANAPLGNFVFSGDQLSVSDNGNISVVASGNSWGFNSNGTTQFPNYVFPSEHGSAGTTLMDAGDGTLSWNKVNYSTSTVELFSGDAVQTDFVLSEPPINQSFIEVVVGGVFQTPGSSYVLIAPQTLHFLSPPFAGTRNIQVRYWSILTAALIPGPQGPKGDTGTSVLSTVTWATVLDKNGVAGPQNIAIGANALATGYGITLGASTVTSSVMDNSIILNATGLPLAIANTGTFVAPVRNAVYSYGLYYNPTTSEITWGNISTGGSSGVNRIVAGTGISVTPSDGTGTVTVSANTNTLVASAVTAQTADYATAFNTATLVTHSVTAQTADYANTFNTSTLVSNAVSAQTADYANTFNTATLVSNAVSAQTADYANTFNTGTLVLQAVTAINGSGVRSITAGTGTYISTSSGNVTIWTDVSTGSGGAFNISTVTNQALFTTSTVNFGKVTITPYPVNTGDSADVLTFNDSQNNARARISWTPNYSPTNLILGGVELASMTTAGLTLYRYLSGPNNRIMSQAQLTYNSFSVSFANSTTFLSTTTLQIANIGNTAGIIFSDNSIQTTAYSSANAVSKIVAGSNVTISPSSGTGTVTISVNTGAATWSSLGDKNNSNGPTIIALGYQAGGNLPYGSIAIGYTAGQTNAVPDPGFEHGSIAIGWAAGQSYQSTSTVAIGTNAGNNNQGFHSVAIGDNAGYYHQTQYCVALGPGAGNNNQNNFAIAVGYNAGNSNQSSQSIAIGKTAGNSNQSSQSIAIGTQAGASNQSNDAIAIGTQAGASNQKPYSIAIGNNSAPYSLGDNSIAIGHNAGYNVASTASIILNATGVALDATVSGVYVKPIRHVVHGSLPAGFYNMAYNPTTGEIIYWT